MVVAMTEQSATQTSTYHAVVYTQQHILNDSLGVGLSAQSPFPPLLSYTNPSYTILSCKSLNGLLFESLEAVLAVSGGATLLMQPCMWLSTLKEAGQALHQQRRGRHNMTT
jgi:hypothetical protein